MPPRNLIFSIVLGAFATLAHPFAFLAKAFGRLRFPVGRSKANTGSWTPQLLKELEWRRFEELCAAYYETLGFRTDPAPSAAGGGAIGLYTQDAERASIVVQCEPWNAYRVGIKPVRGLAGLMASANVVEGVLVTSGKFTQEARTLAGKQKIDLIDGDELLARIAALLPEKALELLKLATQGDFTTPTCPSCAVKMIQRKSTTHGRPYWGCRNYPGCKQTFFDTV